MLLCGKLYSIFQLKLLAKRGTCYTVMLMTMMVARYRHNRVTVSSQEFCGSSAVLKAAWKTISYSH